MTEENDDLIIAVWWRRSLWVFAAIGVAVLALVWWPDSKPKDQVVETRVTAPRSAATATPERVLPVLKFQDQAAARGLAFHFENGAFGQRYLPETMVGGVAVLDFDADGDADVLLTGGNRWPFDPEQSALEQSVGLFENDGAGNFRRVDQQLGLNFSGYAMGAAVGDYNGDGFPDVYITAVGANALFRNQAGKGFVRETQLTGPIDEWSTGAGFFDADNDGWLDLVVVNYVQWSPAIDLAANYQIAGIGRAYGPPTNFPGSLPRLYRNRGDGTFSDVSDTSGIRSVPEASAKSLALITRDFDGDGDTDIFVANDTTANFLYVNEGDGRFSEQGQALGVAFDNTGKATGAMGVDLASVMGPDSLALAVGNFANEMTSFFVDKRGALLFADDAVISGVGPASRRALTFGLFFADLDLDGLEDLVQVNGHVESAINRVQASQQYLQPAQLFWNCGAACPRHFVPLPADHLGDLAQPMAGRGAAYADVDGDGDLDLIVAQTGAAARLLINPQDGKNNWLKVVLRGRAPNTQALGAKLWLFAGGNSQMREITPTRSYLSQTELAATFGLAQFNAASRLEIQWPDGGDTTIENIPANQVLEVRQP